MMLFLQICIVGFTLFIWFLCAKEKTIPHGLIEWILTILSVIILIYWNIRY